jgi:hypothetical protein
VLPLLNDPEKNQMFPQSRQIIHCLVILCAATLSGCQMVQPSEDSTQGLIQNKNVDHANDLSPDQIDRINLLLSDAFLAFQDDRLTTPIEENAYLIYMQVLSIDPKNNYANLGLTEIVEKYLDWALTAAEQKHYRKATDYLNKARSIDDAHPNIKAVSIQIEESRLAKQIEFKLSVSELQNRSNKLVTELKKVALIVEKYNASVVIAARSDKEGRWIYKHLNNATADRVKATFEPTKTPFVRVLYP